jgi:hypothetical protein
MKNHRPIALVPEQFGCMEGICTEDAAFKLTGGVFKSIQVCTLSFSWAGIA